VIRPKDKLRAQTYEFREQQDLQPERLKHSEGLKQGGDSFKRLRFLGQRSFQLEWIRPASVPTACPVTDERNLD